MFGATKHPAKDVMFGWNVNVKSDRPTDRIQWPMKQVG
jgi:hypothetical protein